MTTPRASLRRLLPLAAALWVCGAALSAQAPTAAALYQRAVDAEAVVRAAAAPTPGEIRRVVTAYELVVRKFPKSGLCDNALWQASGMSLLAFRQTSADADRAKGEQLLKWLATEYPSSPFAKQADERLQAFTTSSAKGPKSPPATSAALTRTPAVPRGASTAAPAAVLRGISRVALPGGDRLILDLDREVSFRVDRIGNPDRVLIDLDATAASDAMLAATSALKGMLVTGVRLGHPAPGTTRIAIDLAGMPKHSVYPLYDPYRLVIDAEGPPPPPLAKAVVQEPVLNTVTSPVTPALPTLAPTPPAATPTPGPATAVDVVPVPPPSTTRNGDYSLARQLGLGVQRVVIDAGHGGHDPGAQGNDIVEKELVLDIALRLQKLLQDQPGIDVVLTRGTDEFIPLEERTAIANRAGADLFLSIHANASERKDARGLETYFLNFATNPEAEAVAARENASSSQSMGHLPEILKAIALNAKLAESRELATLVQTSMVRRLKTQSATVRDLGVKQAPFVVLIGAQMPSVLAEISFVTNRTDATALKQAATKQRIAQALCDAIVKYQSSLKKATAVSQKAAKQ